MANRNRTHPVQFYLSDDEQYILNTKFKASGMKSMSAFLRKLILYGYVYDVDYSYLRNYNTELTYQLQFKPDRKESKQHRKHLSRGYKRSKGVDE